MTLLEYSVIYTNRATNLMSQSYKNSFKKLNHNLCHIYNAKKTLIIPGSGSNGMEAVARQFGVNKKCMIMRNGFFSYRWSQILDHGKPYNITDNTLVHQANINIIKTGMEKLGLGMEKTYTNLHKYGNTAGASVPIAMKEAMERGLINDGDLVVTAAFGGGLAWGANVIQF